MTGQRKKRRGHSAPAPFGENKGYGRDGGCRRGACIPGRDAAVRDGRRRGTAIGIFRRRASVRGSITLYLALTLAAVLTLYFVLIGGARLGAARMQMESVSRTAQNAALAEFHQELHRRYDLFMADTSYGGPGGGDDSFAHHLRGYMERCCVRETVLPMGSIRDWTSMRISEVQVPEARYACDNGGRAVREQVYAYMAADPAGSVLSGFLVSADRWKGLEISGREWEVKTQESREELKEALRERRQEQKEENREKDKNNVTVTQEEREAASDKPSEAENMVDEIGSFQFLPILTQVFGSTENLSDRMVRKETGLCGRDVHLGTGMTAENSHGYPAADEILFDRYIYEKTGNCVRPSQDGQLRYQTEYILCGKDTDRGNLEGTAARILLIREASNAVYLFTDEERMARVHLVAAAAAFLLLNPELEDPIANALALAWSYLESVQDVRTLMTGGKVPLEKTSESWQTGLHELLTPLTAIRDRDSGEGIDYDVYLQGLLLIEGRTVKTQRTMGIMEMDVRRITGNSGFRMDLCLDAFRMHAEAEACGTGFSFDGTGGYN